MERDRSCGDSMLQAECLADNDNTLDCQTVKLSVNYYRVELVEGPGLEIG